MSARAVAGRQRGRHRAPPADAATRPARITSVDAVRGLALVWIVVTASLLAPPAWYEHAEWLGVHPVDGVFPSFVALSGCGVALASRRGVRPGRVLRRALVLALAGVAHTAVLELLDADGWPGWSALRLTGVLQLFAAVGVVVALGHLVTRTARGWLLVTAVLAAGHVLLLALWAAGCPGGELTPQCNPSLVLDPALVPARHLYAGMALGHDPEGVVAVLGALVTASAGAAGVHALLAARDRSAAPAAAALPVLGVVAVLALGALASAQVVPAMKRLWTAPFGLVVAAAVLAVLLGAHLLLDRPGDGGGRRGWGGRAARAASWPLVALGRNSLLVYVGVYVLVAAAVRVVPREGGDSLAVVVSEALAVAGHPQVTWSVLLVVLWAAVAGVLHRRRWYLRA